MTTNQQEMFGSLLLDKKIVNALTDMGFEEPSPIQEQTIPLVLRRPVPVKRRPSVFRWCRALPTTNTFRR